MITPLPSRKSEYAMEGSQKRHTEKQINENRRVDAWSDMARSNSSHPPVPVLFRLKNLQKPNFDEGEDATTDSTQRVSQESYSETATAIRKKSPSSQSKTSQTRIANPAVSSDSIDQDSTKSYPFGENDLASSWVKQTQPEPSHEIANRVSEDAAREDAKPESRSSRFGGNLSLVLLALCVVGSGWFLIQTRSSRKETLADRTEILTSTISSDDTLAAPRSNELVPNSKEKGLASHEVVRSGKAPSIKPPVLPDLIDDPIDFDLPTTLEARNEPTSAEPMFAESTNQPVSSSSSFADSSPPPQPTPSSDQADPTWQSTDSLWSRATSSVPAQTVAGPMASPNAETTSIPSNPANPWSSAQPGSAPFGPTDEPNGVRKETLASAPQPTSQQPTTQMPHTPISTHAPDLDTEELFRLLESMADGHTQRVPTGTTPTGYAPTGTAPTTPNRFPTNNPQQPMPTGGSPSSGHTPPSGAYQPISNSGAVGYPATVTNQFVQPASASQPISSTNQPTSVPVPSQGGYQPISPTLPHDAPYWDSHP